MRKSMLLSAGIFFLLIINASSQDKEEPMFYKNQAGLQCNPFVTERLMSTGGLRWIDVASSLRYGYRITGNVFAGMELNCVFPVKTSTMTNFNEFNYFSYNIGLFARYSFRPEKRFQLFAEVSPFYSHYYKEWTSSSDTSPYRTDKAGYYAAPGMTLYSKGKRVSFDLYYKFSNLPFINGNKSVISYKINYNF